MTPAQILEFIRRTREGLFDNQKLQEWVRGQRAGGVDAPHATLRYWIFSRTGYEIQVCPDCARYCFSATLREVAFGRKHVCEACLPAYTWCENCNTNLLAGAPHIHVRHEAVPMGNQVSNFRVSIGGGVPRERSVIQSHAANVLASTPGYLKTKEEQEVVNHREQWVATQVKKGVVGLDNYRPDDFRYFGIELEVEKVDDAPADIAQKTLNVLGGDFVIVKRDGSLSRDGEGGFEIVSAPATLRYHLNAKSPGVGAWDGFFEKLSKNFHENPPTTGMHVHIGRASLTPMVIGKMLKFINGEVNTNFVCDVAGRDLMKPNPNGRNYARIEPTRKISDVLSRKQHRSSCPWHAAFKGNRNKYLLVDGVIQHDEYGLPIIAKLKADRGTVRATCKCPEGHYQLERYEALNVATNKPTIEMRIFKGRLNKDIFYSNLEFCDALVGFAYEFKPEDMVHAKFTDWISKGHRKQYRHLSQYLADRGWIEPPKPQPRLETELGDGARTVTEPPIPTETPVEARRVDPETFWWQGPF